MIWLDLFRRLWPYLAGAFALIGAALWVNHAGYKSGYAASEAHWQPLFAAAALARDEANARAAAQEVNSKALSDQVERQHAESIASLNLRAANAEQHTAGLVRQLSARARSCTMSAAGPSSAISDAAPASNAIADRASADLVELARRCESDGRTLAELQYWVIGQRAILATP